MPTQKAAIFAFPEADKIVHILLHSVLMFLWLLYFFQKKKTNFTQKHIVCLFGFVVAYGIIIELLQYLFTNARQADWFDIIANSIGALLGLMVFRNVKKLIKL